MDPTPLLSLRQATVVRDGWAILDRLTFNLWEGEHVAILGPNGAGKTTLLKLIDMENRSLAMQVPAVTVMGKDRWDVSELRQIIGMVTPSHLRRFEESQITAMTCVLTGFFASNNLYPHMVVTPEMQREAQAALQLAGAAHLADRRLATLSTGESRRILIARALALEPISLLLDEPTAGLDLASAGTFLETVRQIAREGTTIILVTHHVEEILPEVSRVILLNEGKVFFDGPKEEALTNDRLSALYETRVRVRQDSGHFFASLDKLNWS